MYLVCFQIKKRSGRSAFNWVLQWLLYLSADAAWGLTYILRGSSDNRVLRNILTGSEKEMSPTNIKVTLPKSEGNANVMELS